MPEVPETAFVTREQIALLANLYNAFYHSLDDQSREADLAERQFYDEIAAIWETITGRYPSLQYVDFRRKVIEECRNYLRATNRMPTI